MQPNKNDPPLLEIRSLKLDFGAEAQAMRAVDGVSLAIQAGETVCLVGESGCGKSVTALSIARLVPSPPARYPEGEILLNGVSFQRPRPIESIRRGECFCPLANAAYSSMLCDPSSLMRVGWRWLKSQWRPAGARVALMVYGPPATVSPAARL